MRHHLFVGAEGQVQLGMSVEAVDTDPPYAVTFANVDIVSY